MLLSFKSLLIMLNLVELTMDSLDLMGKVFFHFLLVMELLGQISNVMFHGAELHADNRDSTD